MRIPKEPIAREQFYLDLIEKCLVSREQRKVDYSSLRSYYLFGNAPDDVLCVGDEIDFQTISRWSTGRDEWSGSIGRDRDEKGRFLPRKSLVYLIRRSIGQYGYRGINFIDKAIQVSLEKISEDMGEAAEQFLINYLEKNGTIFPT